MPVAWSFPRLPARLLASYHSAHAFARVTDLTSSRHPECCVPFKRRRSEQMCPQWRFFVDAFPTTVYCLATTLLPGRFESWPHTHTHTHTHTHSRARAPPPTYVPSCTILTRFTSPLPPHSRTHSRTPTHHPLCNQSAPIQRVSYGGGGIREPGGRQRPAPCGSGGVPSGPRGSVRSATAHTPFIY